MKQGKSADIKSIKSEYYEQLCLSRFDDLKETDQLQQTHKFPQLSCYKKESLKVLQLLRKLCLERENARLMVSLDNFIKHLKN